MMKTTIKLLLFVTFLFAGSHVLVAQETTTAQSKEDLQETISRNQLAKDRTYELHQIVNLESEQISKVYEMFLAFGKKSESMDSKVANQDASKREKILEDYKLDQLKQILTDTQLQQYLQHVKGKQ